MTILENKCYILCRWVSFTLSKLNEYECVINPAFSETWREIPRHVSENAGDKEFNNYKSFNDYYIDNIDEFETFRISIYELWKELEKAEHELLKKIDDFQK